MGANVMVDRAEVIRQMTQAVLAKRREAQQDDTGGFDEEAAVAAIGQVLEEILADFEGDLSEIPVDQLVAMIDEFVGAAIDEVV